MVGRFGVLLGILVMSCVAFSSLAYGQTIVRGPYLQQGGPYGAIIKWRTDVPTDSRVSYGPSATSLISTRDNLLQSTEHEIALTGLQPNTRYYYSVGSTFGPLSFGIDHFFVTAPSAGSDQPVRIWTFGDAGNGTQDQR